MVAGGTYNPIQVVFQISNSLDEFNLWTLLPSNMDQDYYSVESTFMESERLFILYFLYFLQMEIMEQRWKFSLTNFIFYKHI